MINKTENPVEWALLMYGLDDAREHLEDLVKKMSETADYDEVEFAIDLGHVYAHLNRAWNSRSQTGEFPQERWEELSQFPKDLTPVG